MVWEHLGINSAANTVAIRVNGPRLFKAVDAVLNSLISPVEEDIVVVPTEHTRHDLIDAGLEQLLPMVTKHSKRALARPHNLANCTELVANAEHTCATTEHLNAAELLVPVLVVESLFVVRVFDLFGDLRSQLIVK